jgi:hypothetical protein
VKLASALSLFPQTAALTRTASKGGMLQIKANIQFNNSDKPYRKIPSS